MAASQLEFASKSSNPGDIDPASVPGALDAIDSFRDGWIEILTAQIEAGIAAGWNLLNRDLDVDIDFALVEQRAVQYAREQAAQKITGILETTKADVQDVLTQAVSEGWSINRTADELSALYSDFEISRSITIARTEIAAAMNWGKHEAAAAAQTELGMQLEKRWSAVRDGRTRPTHAAITADWIKFGDTFNVGGYSAMRPYDGNLPASETINCRCVLLTREAKTEDQ